MIDVKQIFESVILSEKLGNLAIVSDKHAKDTIISLLRDKKIRDMAMVTQNSAVEAGDNYSEENFVKTTKKVANLGKRIGLIVFSSADSTIGVVVRDDRYYESGSFGKSTKVFSATNGHLGRETTIGKVMDTITREHKVFYVLVDDAYQNKLETRPQSDQIDNTDKYAPFQMKTRFGVEKTGRTNFMDKARYADIVADPSKPLIMLSKIYRYLQNSNRELSFTINGKEYSTEYFVSQTRKPDINFARIGLEDIRVLRCANFNKTTQEVQPGWLYINKNGEFEVRLER